MKLRFLVAFSVALAIPCVASATPAFDYAQTAVTGLANVREAAYQFQSVNQESDPNQKLVDEMRYTVLLENKIQDANTALIPYITSGDPMFKSSAGLLSQVYTFQYQLVDADAGILERIINKPEQTSQDLGTLLRSLDQSEVMMQETWGLLEKASSGIAISTIDMNRLVNGKWHYLRITAAERGALKDILIAGYGMQIESGGTLPAMDGAGAVLWDFYNNPSTENADDK